jgi:hypothetical protein
MMTEETIAQAEANALRQVLDIMLTISQRGGISYPEHVQIPMNSTLNDLIQEWRNQAEALGVTDHVQYPTIAGAYGFETAKGEGVLNLADEGRIFAYPTVSLLPPPSSPTVASEININVIYMHLSEFLRYHAHGEEMMVAAETKEQDILTGVQ